MYIRPTREQMRFLNRLLTRYPWGCSILLLLAGGAMLLGALFGQALSTGLRIVFFIVSPILLVFGAVSLFVALGESVIRVLRRVVLRPDPTLTILQSAPPFRPGYEQGKTEMTTWLVEKLCITPEEARARVNRLEQKGKIIFMPNEYWVVGE